LPSFGTKVRVEVYLPKRHENAAGYYLTEKKQLDRICVVIATSKSLTGTVAALPPDVRRGYASPFAKL
jgi:hypothetical protein